MLSHAFLYLVIDNMMKENLQALSAHEHDHFLGSVLTLFERSKLKAELLKLCVLPWAQMLP